MSVFRVFTRCNGGHYFAGQRCPFDGWGSEESASIARTAQRLADEGKAPSMAALQAAGLTATAMARACVLEFYATDNAFDAVEPHLVSVDDRAYLLKDAPEGLK